MNHAFQIIATCGLALSLAACQPSSRSSPSQRAAAEREPGGEQVTAQIGESHHGARETCPAGIAGLRVRSESTRNGGALVFTTRRSEQVPELRQRIENFVSAHGEASARTGAGAQTGAQQFQLTRATVRAVDVPNGSRLEVTPRDASQLQTLRRELRANASDLREGNCPVSFRPED